MVKCKLCARAQLKNVHISQVHIFRCNGLFRKHGLTFASNVSALYACFRLCDRCLLSVNAFLLDTRTHADTREHTPTHADKRRHTQTHADTCGHTLTYAGIRGHADIRGHQWAHVDTFDTRTHSRIHAGTRRQSLTHIQTYADTRVLTRTLADTRG